jgi:hypothetical protein
MNSLIQKAESWSDYLSPILIKEFRQGLRSQVFTWAFMLVHLFMVGGLLFSLGMGSSAGGRTGMNILFWLMVSAPLLLFLPFGAMGSVSLERRDGTLDLLQLAHQNTFRLILGKWLGHGALTLLLVMAISPYMVFRYYIGGMDVFSDLQTLWIILLASGILTGLAILCSSYNVHPMRQWLSFLALGYVFLMFLYAIFFALSRDTGFHLMTTGLGKLPLQGIYIYIPFISFALLYILLKWATIQVAPESEYHGLALRWFYVVFMLCNILFAWFWAGEITQVIGGVVAVIMTILVNVRGLSEAPAIYGSQVAAFCKRGWIHQVHAFFMAPGWASGFFFAMLSLVLLFVNFICIKNGYQNFISRPQEAVLVYITIFMAIVSPILLGHLLPWGPKSPILKSILIAIVLGIPCFLYALGHNLHEPWEDSFKGLGQLLPVSSALLYGELGYSRIQPMVILGSHALLWIFFNVLCYANLRPTFSLIERSGGSTN